LQRMMQRAPVAPTMRRGGACSSTESNGPATVIDSGALPEVKIGTALDLPPVKSNTIVKPLRFTMLPNPDPSFGLHSTSGSPRTMQLVLKLPF